MKCDELKAFRIIQGDTGGCGAPSYKCEQDGKKIEEWNDMVEVVEALDAFDAIDGLKAENERLERELEHVKNGDCINTCDVVEKYVQKLHDAEIALRVKSEDCVLLDEQIKRFERMRRQTLRALGLARAESAKNAVTNWCPECMQRWNKVERLCRAKDDTFKEDV